MTGEIVPEQAVRFVRALPATPGKVWAFLTDSTRLPEWYGKGSIAPHEGGAVSLMGGHVRGVVKGWRPEKFLGYTWSVFSPGGTESKWPVSYLEFTLDGDDGGTRLTLVHRPIPEAMQKQTMMGWHTMLDLLDAAARGEFPKRVDIFPKNAALYGVDMNNLAR
jgi:uncharacterized protein YndB with AHSA1/START domain